MYDREDFFEPSWLISGHYWFLIYLFIWSSSGLSLKQKFGLPKTLRSPPIPTAWGKLRQLNSCPKAMFLKVSFQDPKISTSAQWFFWRGSQQEGLCLHSLPPVSLKGRPPCEGQLPASLLGSSCFSWCSGCWWGSAGWGSPASFWKPRRYGDCVQLYDLFVVHLSQSEMLLELLYFQCFSFKSLVGGFEFKRKVIHCEEKLPETFVVHCCTLLLF